MSQVAIFLCDITGTMAEPWLEGGYEAILVDPQHPEGCIKDGPVTRVGHVIDHVATWSLLRSVIRGRRIAFVAGFPPCTDLAVSGSRWFEEKGRKDWGFQFKAMQVVWQCHVIGELAGAPFMVENPVSVISSLWRKPDQSFSPCDYTGYDSNDNYTKKNNAVDRRWLRDAFAIPRFHIGSTGQPNTHSAAFQRASQFQKCNTSRFCSRSLQIQR